MSAAVATPTPAANPNAAANAAAASATPAAASGANNAAAANAAGAPVANPFASASLYVGDLAPEVNESMLYEIFNAVGPVASVRVCRDALTRRSLGYAYVNFHEVRDAERALDTMNFSMIHNRTCRIMWSQRDPTLRRSGAGNIYVKNLDGSIDSKTLYDTFSVFGNILSCKVVCNQRGDSLGYGFVHFEADDSARNAINTVNGKMLAGKVVTVQPFKSRKERETSSKKFTNVFVKNLPNSVNDQNLKAFFSKFGTVTSVYLPVDEKNNNTRGFGMVNFEKHEDAAHAVEAANEQTWDDKKLYVAKAQKKADRERELRARFEQIRIDRQNRFAGINLYIKNLSETMTDQRLIEEFKKFGNITSARVMVDANGRSRQFGFVCFTSSDEATKAVTEMNGKMLDGKPLYVALAQPKEVRRAALEARFNRVKMPYMNPAMYAPQGPPFFFNPGMPQRIMVPSNFPRQPVPRWPQPNAAPGRAAPAMVNLPYGQGGYPVNAARGGAMARGRGARGGKPRVSVPPSGPGSRGPIRTNSGDQVRYTSQARNKPGPGQIPMGGNMQVPMPAVPAQPLTVQELASLSEPQQKKVIGERLFPLIHQREPTHAPKITGMLLEMDNGELLHLLESQEALGEKINEALVVLGDSDNTAGGDETQA